MPTTADGVPLLHNVLKLATAFFIGRIDQIRVIHQLAQLGKRLDHHNAILGIAGIKILQQVVACCRFLPIVNLALLIGQFRVEDLRGEWWEVLGYFFLGASQKVRLYQFSQLFFLVFILLPLNGYNELLAEEIEATQ